MWCPQGSHAIQNMNITHHRCKKDVTPERSDPHHSFFWTVYTFGPLRSWIWFQSMLSTNWPIWRHCGYYMHIVSLKGNVICKKHVLKLVGGVFVIWFFVNIFFFETVWRCWIQNIRLSADQLPTKPPEGTRRSTWRRSMATWMLQSFCCPKGLRWMPRPTMARGLKASQAVAGIQSPSRGFPPLNIPQMQMLGSMISM